MCGVVEPSVSSESDEVIDADMKAARVLPEPVGAAIKVCRSCLICGHALSCGSVAPGKVRTNQRATAGWNKSKLIRDGHYNPQDDFCIAESHAQG